MATFEVYSLPGVSIFLWSHDLGLLM